MAGRTSACLFRAAVSPLLSRPSPLLSSSFLSSSPSPSLLQSSHYSPSLSLSPFSFRHYTTIDPPIDPIPSSPPPPSSSSSSSSSSLPPRAPSESAMMEKAEKMLGLAKESASVGKFDKALVILNGAAVLNPPNNQKCEIFLWTGYVHQSNSSFETALSFLEKGLALCGENNETKLWGMMNQAECLAKTGEINQAVDVVKAVLPLVEQQLGKDSEFYGSALGNLCAYLALCEGREDEAIEAGKEGFLLLKQRVGLQNSLTTGIFQNLNRIVERTGRTDVFDNIEKELQKIEATPKLIFNHFEVVKRGGGGGGRGGEWAGGEWRDKKRKLKGYLEEYLDEVAHEGVETKKFFDPRGLIRTKKLVKSQLDDFLATWKISGHFLDSRSEKLFEEMIERSIDDEPTNNEIDHVVDQAITTGELTKEQARVLAMREEFRKKKETKVPPPPAYEDEDLEDIQWLGEESDEMDLAPEEGVKDAFGIEQEENNYFADEDEGERKEEPQEEKKEKKEEGEVEDYYLDEWVEGEVAEEGYDDGGYVGDKIEMKRREVGGAGGGEEGGVVDDLDGGFYDYEDEDDGYVTVDEDVLGDNKKD